MKLKYKEMMEYSHLLENLEPGDQIYTHHCKEGKDNDRLNIKFHESGEYYLFHCLHCGSGGRLNSATHSATERLKRYRSVSASNVHKSISLPRDLENPGGQWPAYAVHWLYQYGIRQPELRDNGVAYSPSKDRIILPVYQHQELIGYTERRVNPRDQGPKYIEHVKKGHKLWKHIDLGTDTCVLVEDYLSCIKVSRVCSCIALLGTDLNDAVQNAVLKYSTALIFMDDDNSKVKTKQLKARDQLNLLGVQTTIVHSEDPKRLSDQEIQEIVYGKG